MLQGQKNEMNDVLGHNSALYGYHKAVDTKADEMNFW